MFVSCYLDSNDTHSSSTASVLDTGASSHISYDMQELANRSSLRSQDIRLRIGDGLTVEALAIGSKSFYMSGHVLCLNNILYVTPYPSVRHNMIP